MARDNTRARALEVTVLSADDLRINKKPIKNNAFVVVRSSAKSEYSTTVDTTGENYPVWNQKLHVDLPRNAQHLQVEVRRRSSGGSDLFVAAARIPVMDFIGDYTPEKYLHFLSYRLRDDKGRKNGVVNVSVRVTSSQPDSSGWSTSGSAVEATAPPMVPELGIPVMVRQRVEGRYGGGTVTGVPLWGQNTYRSS